MKKKIKIRINVYNDNGQNIEQVKKYNKNNLRHFDPMFLMENSITKDVAECREFEGITSKKYGDTISHTFSQSVTTPDGMKKIIEHKIRLRFSYVKKEVREWYKQLGGKPAGKRPLGQLYKNRNDINVQYPSISILRANREIDHNNYGFVQLSTGAGYEMERWYSVELFIDTPESDWIFEIDNRKQNARIYKMSEANDFKEEVHKDISKWIEMNISEMRKKIKTQTTAKGSGGKKDKELVGEEIADDFVQVPTGDDNLKPSEVSKEERVEITNWIIDIYPDLKKDKKRLNNVIQWCLALPCRHYIIYRPLGQMDLYSFKSMGTERTVIEINTNHTFYQEFIDPIEKDDNQQAKDILRLLFSSLVSAEQTATQNSREKQRLLQKIRLSMALELEDFIDELIEA